MWSLIFFIGTCSALPVKEHWRHVSDDGIELRRGKYGVHIKENTLWNIAPMAVASEPGGIIDLSSLNIKEIRNNVFDYLANMTVLNLANNKLENIPPLIFGKLKTLKTLSLADNKLRTFDRCFVGLRNLKSLDLSNNLIESLTSGDLLGLPKSVNLTTTGNPLKKFAINFGKSSLPYYVPSESDRNPWSDRIFHVEPAVKMWRDLENAPVNSSYQIAQHSYNSSRFYLRLCKSNRGVVESLNIAEVKEALGNCQIIIPNGLSLTLNLENLEISQFHPIWYRIKMDLFETLSLSSNKITNISSTLLENIPDSLVSVELESNSINRIEKNIIRNEFLKKISFAFNQIEKVEDEAFAETNLVSISFAYNNLKNNLNFTKTLPASIRELILTGNGISEVPEDFITNLTALTDLDLANNWISHLSANTFRGLKKLRIIDLSSNSLEIIEPGTFEDQEELSDLLLDYNDIKKLTPGSFNGLKMLLSLSLPNNKITKIERGSFSELKNSIMYRLDLYGNKIDTIEEGSFSFMTIRELDIGGNNISEKSVAKGAFELCTVHELFYAANPIKNISGDGFDGLLLYKEKRFSF